MDVTVIVIGKHYMPALGVIRSLGMADFRVDLVYIAKSKGASYIASKSQYVHNVIEIVQEDEEYIVNILKKRYDCSDKKVVLFPIDDYAISLIDNNREYLNGFVMPYIKNGKPGDFQRLMNKSEQSRLAKKHGCLVPVEWVVNLNHKIEIPDDLVYPCYCKPLISVEGSKAEMCRCDTRNELIEQLKEMKKGNSKRSVLIQEFLDINCEYLLSGVCLDQIIYIPCVVKKLCLAKHNKGLTLLGQLISISEMKEMVEILLDFLKSIHYVGMFDLEIIESGGQLYFNELNLRISGIDYAISQSGYNSPERLVNYLVGIPTSKDAEEVKIGKVFFNNKVAWEDYLHSTISKKDLKKYIKKADFTLLNNPADIIPERIFTADMKRKVKIAHIKNVIKKCCIFKEDKDG